MNCSEFRELLSPYLDGELSAAEHSSAEDHLRVCSRCAAEAAELKRLSQEFRQLQDPEPPADLWDRLQRQERGKPGRSRSPVSAESFDATKASVISASPHRRFFRWFSVAALLGLLAVGLGVLFQSLNHADHHTVDLDGYLSSFTENPTGAQKKLLTAYQHVEVTDEKEAKRRLGYLPAVADGLPEGVTLRKLHVIEMPCCTCAQAECEVDGRDTVVLFEHDREDSFRFGRRSSVVCSCCGRRMQLIPFDGRLVASWERGSRHLTLIGARDLSQVVRFVEKLQ